MQLRLSCDDDRVNDVALDGQTVAIGRHPDNAIIIRDDLASRFHCVLEPADGDMYRLRDLGSRNGTKMAGERISEVLLSDGDVFTIGKRTFTIRNDAAVEVVADPPSTGTPRRPRRRPKLSHPVGQAASGGGDAAGGAWEGELEQIIERLGETESDGGLELVDTRGGASHELNSDSDGPVAVRLLLETAAATRATDIHCEPKGSVIAVRMRVDGQMVPIVELPNSVGDLVNGLIRTACQMKQAGRDALQDGSFTVMQAGRRIDFRASLTPTVHGQKLVLRVLDSRVAPQNLTDLQMPAYMQRRIQSVCEQDTGLLLAAGPTGSGKTTTLYNALRELDRQARNVVTIEDPVEYHIDNVTQIPAAAEAGFGEVLRSVLRQDPDVILVGEIRDDETARVTMQAAMTGHVVFSTVHAKDTIGAVFRLLDLGVERYLVANALDLILAQRLVRVLCDDCKRPVRVSPGQSSRMGRFLEGRAQVFAATGCATCLRTGYRGRRALFEMLDFNDELRDIVLHNPTIQSMRKCIEQGVFTTLRQAGWLLAARGITSLDEVDRVAGQG